jgi:hypothetical protein
MSKPWARRQEIREAVMNQTRVELYGEVLLYLDTIAGDAEASGTEEMEQVADYVRGVLMPLVVGEQGWAVLSEGTPADW